MKCNFLKIFIYNNVVYFSILKEYIIVGQLISCVILKILMEIIYFFQIKL